MARTDGGWQPPTGISPRPMLMGAPRNALRAFNAGVSLSQTRSHGRRAATHGCRPVCSLAYPVIWMGLGAPSTGSSGSERYPFAYAAQSALSRCIYQAVLYISREKRLSHHRSLSPPIYECGGGSREAPASPHTRFYLRRYADSISRNCIFVGGFLNGLPVI